MGYHKLPTRRTDTHRRPTNRIVVLRQELQRLVSQNDLGPQLIRKLLLTGDLVGHAPVAGTAMGAQVVDDEGEGERAAHYEGLF